MCQGGSIRQKKRWSAIIVLILGALGPASGAEVRADSSSISERYAFTTLALERQVEAGCATEHQGRFRFEVTDRTRWSAIALLDSLSARADRLSRWLEDADRSVRAELARELEAEALPLRQTLKNAVDDGVQAREARGTWRYLADEREAVRVAQARYLQALQPREWILDTNRPLPGAWAERARAKVERVVTEYEQIVELGLKVERLFLRNEQCRAIAGGETKPSLAQSAGPYVPASVSKPSSSRPSLAPEPVAIRAF